MKYAYVLLFLPLFFTGCVVTDDDGGPDTPSETPLPSLKVGLLGHWDFLGNADDASAQENHGVISGARLTSDRHGNENSAYRFDGVDDYINVGAAQNLLLSYGGNMPYTISAWVKPSQTTGHNFFISKFNGGVRAGWYLQMTDERHIRTYRNLAPWSVQSVDQFPHDEWIHCIGLYDGTNLKIYVDGALQASLPFGSNPSDLSTDILIGAHHSRGEIATFYKGDIDEIRLYNRALTDDEIKYLAEH